MYLMLINKSNFYKFITMSFFILDLFSKERNDFLIIIVRKEVAK